MLSSATIPNNDDDSALPGDYQSFERASAPNVPFSTPSSQRQPTVPSARPLYSQPFTIRTTGRLPRGTSPSRLPVMPPKLRPSRRKRSMVSENRPISLRRCRRRSLGPDIVIDPRSCYRSSKGRHCIIRIPLDHGPTLGLRGLPKRMLEIERVRCRRRRRPRSLCYEYDDYCDDVPPQPTTIIANPIPNPCLPSVQPSLTAPPNTVNGAAVSAFLANLTPDMMENLPRKSVHLPPIHLPGSRANVNTELHTVVFPVEVINPVDATLSIVQPRAQANSNGIASIQPNITILTQPQLINTPTVVSTPVTPRAPPMFLATGADPLMDRFHQLFQRLRIPQSPSTSSPTNPSVTRATLSSTSALNPTATTVNNPTAIPFSNTANIRGYPAANIQRLDPSNTASYRPPSVALTIPANAGPYRPPSNVSPLSTSVGTYRPANTGPYRPPSNVSPLSTSVGTYRPANTIPYRPSSFTPSSVANNATYHPTNAVSSGSSNISPYPPANITPYANRTDRSNFNPSPQSTFSSRLTPHNSVLSIASSRAFTTVPPSFSSEVDNGHTNSQPLSSNHSIPKSILRNRTSTGVSNISNIR